MRDEKKKDFLLKDLCVQVLLAADPEEKNLSGEEKLNRFNLANKIKNGGEVELETEDVAKIKAMVGKYSPTLWMGQAFAMLEGKENPLDNKK